MVVEGFNDNMLGSCDNVKEMELIRGIRLVGMVVEVLNEVGDGLSEVAALDFAGVSTALQEVISTKSYINRSLLTYPLGSSNHQYILNCSHIVQPSSGFLCWLH